MGKKTLTEKDKTRNESRLTIDTEISSINNNNDLPNNENENWFYNQYRNELNERLTSKNLRLFDLEDNNSNSKDQIE